jgi:hypothetical protein
MEIRACLVLAHARQNILLAKILVDLLVVHELANIGNKSELV